MKQAIEYLKNINANYKKSDNKEQYIQEVFLQLAMTKRNKEIVEQTLRTIGNTNHNEISRLDFEKGDE